MVSKKVVLKFPQKLVEEPIVCKLVKDYDLDFNILKAYVTPQEEGLLVLELAGESENYKKGIDYVKKLGVVVQPLSKDVRRNEEKCTHCGACVTICPTDALVVDPKTRKINFDQEKCIACELCINGCPPRAMEIHF